MLELCDMHAHFLPGMDDGCKTAEEAVQLLKDSFGQGVRRMFATPHYYPVESVEAFVQRRQESVQLLHQVLEVQSEPVPEFLLGAEAAYHPGLGQESDLQALCLGNSRYLLLEMPFQQWSGETLRTVRNICLSGFVPVIAHVERYWKIQSAKTMDHLLELDVLVQMNTGNLLRFGSAGFGRRLLKNGVVQLLGSDCHNLTARPQNLGQAAQALKKHKMEQTLFSVCQLSNGIFSEGSENKNSRTQVPASRSFL